MSLCRSISLMSRKWMHLLPWRPGFELHNVSCYASALTHPHQPGAGPKSSKAQLKEFGNVNRQFEKNPSK